jgi:hypothetical protein
LNSEFGAAGAAGGAGGGGGGGGRGGFGGGRGSLVDPGEYTVTISQNGKTDTRKVTIEEDPRVTLSAEDRAKRRKAIDTLVTLTKEADAARRRIAALNTAMTSLTDSWKGANAPAIPEPAKKAADDLAARVKTADGRFASQGGFGFGGGGGGGGGGRGGAGAAGAAGGAGGGGANAGPPPPFTPPPVTQKIGRLLGSIDGYTAAPTKRQLADIDEVAAELKKETAEVDKLWEEVPKLNQQLKDAGVQYFKIGSGQ